MISLLTTSSLLGVGLLMTLGIALTGCTATSSATATRVTPSASESNRALVQSAFDRWRNGDGSPFELLADNARWTIVGSSPLSKTYRSKQQFIDEVITPFNARVRGPLVPTVRGLFADGDIVIIFFDGATIANDGLPYRNTYTWYFTMKGGRVIDAAAFFDTRLFDDLWNRVPPNA